MGYAELINTVESLPPEKQAEVYDFVEFISRRCIVKTEQPLDRHEEISQAWNAFNERTGSFAAEYSTL